MTSTHMANLICHESYIFDTEELLFRDVCASVTGDATWRIIYIVITLIFWKYSFGGRSTDSRYQQGVSSLTFPGHIARWMLYLLVIIVLLASIFEGILSVCTFAKPQFSIPFLCLPSIITTASFLLCTFYSYKMEKWRSTKIGLTLLLFWVLSVAGQTVQAPFILPQRGQSITMRGMLCLMLLLLFACLVCLEIYVILKTYRKEQNMSQENLIGGEKRLQGESGHIYSKLIFSWLDNIFLLGTKRPLRLKDFDAVPENLTTITLQREFNELLQNARVKARTGGRLSLLRLLWQMVGSSWATTVIIKLVIDMISFVQPLSVILIIRYAESLLRNTGGSSEPHYVTPVEFFENGFILIVFTSVLMMIIQIADRHITYLNWQNGVRIQTSLFTWLYTKLSAVSPKAFTFGEEIEENFCNSLASDSAVIVTFMSYALDIIAVPVKICVTFFILYKLTGVAAILGLVFFVFVLLILYICSKYMKSSRRTVLRHAYDRIKKTTEVITSIKMLKIYGWEEIFARPVLKSRREEIESYRMFQLIVNFAATLCYGSPLLVSILLFGTYPLFNDGLMVSSEVAFAVFALLNLLRQALMSIPVCFTLAINSLIGIRRLDIILLADELGPPNRRTTTESFESDQGFVHGHANRESVTLISPSDSSDRGSMATPLPDEINSITMMQTIPNHDATSMGNAIEIKNGTFSWDYRSKTLDKINVEFPTGRLTMITGVPGSGKSSLLSAILGDIPMICGSVYFAEEVPSTALASQITCMMNLTIRENILFSSPYNADRYKEVIYACALEPDLKMLPAGELTDVGDCGVNLSEGLKQRINVARALYSDKKIVIMDDPFSGLDGLLGEQVLKEAVLKFVKRDNRTGVLVTHHLQHMYKADHVIIMENGIVTFQGPPTDIPEGYYGCSTKWDQDYVSSGSESEWDINQAECSATKTLLRRNLKKNLRKNPNNDHVSETSRLIADEKQESGRTSFSVYAYYLSSIGFVMCSLTVIMLFMTFVIETSQGLWFARWMEAVGPDMTADENRYYLIGYAGLSLGMIGVGFLNLIAPSASAMTGAAFIFRETLKKIVRLPVRYFDGNPIGRILNRFTNNTNTLDDKAYKTVLSVFTNISLVVVPFLINEITSWLFTIFLIPILVAFFVLIKLYFSVIREIYRCTAEAFSSIFSFFNESLQCSSAIRAYRVEERFTREAVNRIEPFNALFHYQVATATWINIRMDFVCVLTTLFAGISSLLSTFYFGLPPSFVGLAISATFGIAANMKILIFGIGQVEMIMHALERNKEYIDIETENNWIAGIMPSSQWPRYGNIAFHRVCARYDENLPPVLRNITLRIKAGQRVGICGRTGSGKSSLTMTLLKFIDIYEGFILIDGVDISTVPAKILRTKISTIPQDPALFQGTIRYNLDPRKEKTDKELWKALELVQLKYFTETLEKKLGHVVAQNGSNLSVGQRQLFCLARAYIRDSRILIVDEATTSVDFETDQILQAVVRKVFAGKTVLTVAHRISSILDSDLILVLKDGNLIELGNPKTLLTDKGGAFYSLVKAEKRRRNKKQVKRQ